jgi:hypothetical protein
VTIEEVIFYLQSEFAAQERMISESLKNFIEVVSYILPNFAVFDFTVEAAHGLAISSSRLLLSGGYGVVYTVILLLLASCIFQRRKFN